MPHSNTFYDILGVDPDASSAEIKTAFQSEVKTSHPDKHGSRLDFQRTVTARDVLLDDEQRELYDDVGHERYCNLKDIPTHISTVETAQSTNTSDPTTTSPATQTTSDHTSSTSTSRTSSTSTTSTNSSTGSTDQTAHASSANHTTQKNSQNTEQSTTGTNTANSFSFPNPTIGIHSFGTAARKTVHGMGWFVETTYRSMIAVHYGLFALLVSSMFIGTIAYNPIPRYIKLLAGVLLFAMWGYMVLDWKLGVSGFLSAILLTTYDLNNTQLNPFIEHYQIITTALAIGLIASFAMKLYYDRNNVYPRSIMPKLAGWDESRCR